MSVQVINIGRYNDNEFDFDNLFRIYQAAMIEHDVVRFDFTNCDFLRSNAIVMLGGIARLIESQGRSVQFNWNTINCPNLHNFLCANEFANQFGYNSNYSSSTSIPYREDSVADLNGISDYLKEKWLGNNRVNFSEKLKDEIVGKKWEIYANAFEHGRSSVGVFSCGQYFPNKKDLILSVVDFGVGIPESVRSFYRTRHSPERVNQINDAECMKWAFQKGNTTKCDIPRGLGLDFLKSFITLNHGKLEMYSNAGYVIVDHNGERHQNRPVSFPGTLVHITLRCDEKLYRLSSEQQRPF
jgi:hypothetical protein